VALAHAARCAIGHVDHGLRPESEAEARKVQELAARIGVPFFLERLENLRVRGAGLEAAAREARYGALTRIASKAGAQLVATAHTRRDQAETLLLRLARGAGPGALAGIRRRRSLVPGIDLVRPFLEVPREATEAYCRQHRLSWTDDPHNSDPVRARARLRAAWPALLQLNPRLEEALAGAAAILAEENEFLDALAAKLDLRADAPAALLRRALLARANAAGVRPERQHLEKLRQLLARGRGSLDIPGGRAIVEQGAVRFERAGEQPAPPPPEEVAIAAPGRYSWRSRELLVGEGKHAVDLDKAPFPWTLRAHRPGDRFRPGGGRSKKIADLWIDAHIPRERRPYLALLEDAQGRVFWVEGVREGAARGSSIRFEMRPEMDGLAAALTSKRRPESGSATMRPRPDEEPR
jgi:tRNA(Ile)-lysidine synthase